MIVQNARLHGEKLIPTDLVGIAFARFTVPFLGDLIFPYA
jgi:hypothetical protein